jgi:NAD dependent epimerase/dehydratase family enzyme
MTDRWLGYSAFHLGAYKTAMLVYDELSKLDDPPPDTDVNLACCYFFLGMYTEAEKVNITKSKIFHTRNLTSIFIQPLKYNFYCQITRIKHKWI